MKVILTENVKSLGQIGDIVEVKRGHARNYLMPEKLAVEANPRNVKAIDHQRRLLSQKMSKQLSDSKKFAEELDTVSLTLSKKAGEQNKLFGSVTDMDIEKALNEKGYPVTRKMIQLDEPIKTLGVYNINLKIHPETDTKIKLWIIKE